MGPSTPQSWRLIPLMAAPGAVHMAIDAWLLDQHLHHGHPSTLRFYTWNPPAISLGISQRCTIPDHWQELTWQGQSIELIQRPTGGRGVLHQGDLTYAIVTSGLAGSREQVYRHLCQFLIQGWKQLGMDLSFGDPTRPYLNSHHCFGLSTAADLVTAAGMKLIGSAQLRRDGGVLQHGSMRLYPDPDLYERVFQTPDLTLTKLRSHPLPPFPQIVETLTQAAAACWGCQFITQPLTQEELQAIQATLRAWDLDPLNS